MKLNSSKMILAVVLMLAHVGIADTWTDPETGRTWSYRKVGDTAEITKGQYSNWTGDLIIPDKMGEIKVSSIGSSAFSGCSGIMSVTIPDGVTCIGDRAFQNCTNLTSVTMPDSVTSICYYAFRGCSGLTNVTMPDSVTSIEYWAFEGCSRLTSLTIPESVTIIEGFAFDGCSRLTSVYLPTTYTRSTSGVFPSKTKIIRYKPLQIVLLETGGGSVESGSIEVCYGAEYGELPIPIREGYTFIGWWRDVGYVDADTVVSSLDDHTLYADWQINQYIVTFDANGGEGGSSATIDYGAAIVPPMVTRIGYTFKGWLPDVAATVPTADVTYTAQWQINQYTVTFNANGGVGGSRTVQDYGSAIVSPTVTRTGYTFTGWWPTVAETVPAANVTYTAQWSPLIYEVSFDLAGGTDVSGILNVTYDTVYGDLPTPSRLGYSFDGWIINGEKITSDTIVSTPSNHVLTASWIPNRYPMVFNANGGSGGCTLMQEYDTPVTAPEVSRTGYSFAGWSPSILTNVPAEALEFVAQWTANSYEVAFDLMGGIEEFDPLTLVYDGNYGELPVPEREGYAFQGWSLNGNMVNADTILATSSNHVLTAVWQGNEYIVSLDPNGGIVEPETKSVVYGDAYGDLPIPVRNGYDFVAWLCNGHVIESDTVVSTASNHTFVAQWDANQYQVSFDPKGGSLQGESANKTVTYDAEYGELPEPSRVGYTFVGWMLGDVEVSSSSVVATACDHVLSAAWTANRYVVALNPNEGVLDPASSTIEVVFDSAYGELPQPERIGYGFAGWATSLVDGEVIAPDSLATTNQVLYAVWEANQYRIVYDANNDSGDTYSTDAVYDEDSVIKETPFVWLAHVFVGWSDLPDGEVVYEPEEIVRNLTVEPDGAVTLYAVWRPLVVAAPIVSPSDGTSFIEDTSLVTITCATEGADIYYSTKGTPPRIRESYRYTGPFEITDTTTIMAVAVREGVMSEVNVATISRRGLTIPEASGAKELIFETGGDAEWEPTADKTSPNGLSVKSGAIGCAEFDSTNITWLETSVEGMGTLSFQWKVDCEHDYTGMCLWDHLVVSTNGVEVARIDGSQDWTEVSLSFGSGSNVIRWAFVKDDEDDDYATFEDRAWISCVTWTPTIPPSVEVLPEKGTVEVGADGVYVVTAGDGVTLSPDDFTFSVAREAYVVTIAEDGKSATVALAMPTIGLADGEDGVSKDDADPSGMLVIVDDGRISARPVVGEGEVVGVLPVKTYAGLYYQVAWGPTLDSMTTGEKVKATGDMLYLGVVRQTGASGFYKIMVSER